MSTLLSWEKFTQQFAVYLRQTHVATLSAENIWIAFITNVLNADLLVLARKILKHFNSWLRVQNSVDI